MNSGLKVNDPVVVAAFDAALLHQGLVALLILLLGADDRRVELVAIVASPADYQIGYLRAFDRQQGLASMPNWLYLTGSLAQLGQVWRAYGIAAQIEPAGAMTGHSEIAFAIDTRGRVRQELNVSPGPGTAATRSSVAAELTCAARQLLGQS